jgi:hypothetical protein
MNPNMKLAILLIIVTSLFSQWLYAAEATEPSEAELLKAYAADIASIQSNLPGMPKDYTPPENMTYRVHAVKKLACEKALGKPGYVCDSLLDETYPMQKRSKNMHEDRFIMTSDKSWMVIIPPARNSNSAY